MPSIPPRCRWSRRADLTRYAARVAKGNPGDTTALRLARQRIAAGDRNFRGFASGLSAEEKTASADLIEAYTTFSGNLRSLGRRWRAATPTPTASPPRSRRRRSWSTSATPSCVAPRRGRA